MNGPRHRPTEYNHASGNYSAYRKAQAGLDEALTHLHRLVDHQDDECQFDHHGLCQAHFIDGSEPGKCGVVAIMEVVGGVELAVGDLHEVLRQLDEARSENQQLRSHDANTIARQLADRTDELATLQQQFNDFRDVCSGHSADRAVEQVRLEDAEAALVRYGNEMARLATAADAFRRQRDEAREQLSALKPVWESRYSDATYTTKEHALAAAENDGYRHEGDAAVCWRLAGPWHDGTTEPPQHGQEAAQETPGDDADRSPAGDRAATEEPQNGAQDDRSGT